MQIRLRMLMGATALLYFGPLLAGLGGFGWAVVPAFAAIFMLWLLIIRPQDFPRKPADWMRPEALVALAARSAVQVLLVLVCFGVGRGIGGVLGSLPGFPLMLPIAISFLSIPLARLIWDPWKVQAMDRLLDDALTEIEGGTAERGDRSYAEAVLAPLNGLPDAVSEAELESHLSAIRALVDESLTFDVLLDRVKSGEASVAGRKALMVIGSDGAALERMARDTVPTLVMQALGQDGPLIARFAARLALALFEGRNIWSACPSVAFLGSLSRQLPEATAAIGALEAEIMAQA